MSLEDFQNGLVTEWQRQKRQAAERMMKSDSADWCNGVVAELDRAIQELSASLDKENGYMALTLQSLVKTRQDLIDGESKKQERLRTLLR